jgi:DNA-binding transcriptional MerR regulator
MQLTGVPYSTLNLWAKNGLVQPSVAPGTGTGSERVYSFSDLVALKVAFELRKSGVTTSSIKRVVEFLRENEHMNKPLSEARLVVRGRDVARASEDASAGFRAGQYSLGKWITLLAKYSVISSSGKSVCSISLVNTMLPLPSSHVSVAVRSGRTASFQT